MFGTSIIGGDAQKLRVEDRTFNLTLFFSALTVFVGYLWDLVLGISQGFNFFLLGLSIFYSFVYYVSRMKQKYGLAKKIMYISLLVILPVVWRYNQGMTGTSPFYFYTFVLLMISSLRTHRLLTGLSFVGFVVLLAMAEYCIPGYVFPPQEHALLFWDFLVSFVVSSTVFIFGAIYLKDNFDRERLYAQSQKREVEQQRDYLQQLINDTEKQNAVVKQQKQELEESNNINNKLFSIISHDLRSPMANLGTLLQILAYSDPTPEESRSLMNNLQKDLQNTSALLENLLSWSKKQREGEKYSPKYFTLKELVDENMVLVQNQAQIKGIELHNEVSADIQVFADHDMVRLVLRNLISNAIKFCRRNDSISVLCKVIDQAVEVSVCDTGIGISEKNQMKVFNTFDYTERGTANEKGSGLGLFLCRDFIKLNGGRIWFKSKPEKGTCFYFTLPIFKM